jgi:double-stranded uracil-DNA glycosylase
VVGGLPDIIGPNLDVLFCGINPGLYSAKVGHHFARKGNRFWAALYSGGFTERLFDPAEDRLLLELGCGMTNIVARPSAAANELTTAELVAGRRVLERKVRRHAPRWIAILGIQAYRIAFAQPRAAWGEQESRLGEAGVWVLPNPSGLNAAYQPARLADAFRELRAVTLATTPGCAPRGGGAAYPLHHERLTEGP